MTDERDNSDAIVRTAPLTQDDLAQVMDAYGAVTERLQRTQETLTEEVRRLQRELASANAEVVRSKRLAALGEMAAGIAHEVRNPLASIRLYATMLEEDLEPMPEQRDIAVKIGSAVRGLDAVVGDVLTFAREMRLQRVTSPPRDIFNHALSAAAPLLEEARARIAWTVDDEELPVWHDPGLLHRALLNLIRNAAQAMKPGGVLTLGARLSDGMSQLSVADTGPGISDDQIDRIFNPFFTTRATGTGLGLPIVHRIVDAHGGSIGVHNAGGAVFTLTLPLEKTQTPSTAPTPGAPAPGVDPNEHDAWPDTHVTAGNNLMGVSPGA